MLPAPSARRSQKRTSSRNSSSSLGGLLHLVRERENVLLHVVARTQRAEPGDVGRDRSAHFEDGEPDRGHVVAGAGVLRHDREEIEAGVALEVEHLRAATLRDLHEPDLLEPLERFAHHVPVDVEHHRQRPLGRQMRSGGVAPRDDLGRHLLEDLFGERTGSNRVERHCLNLLVRARPGASRDWLDH